MLAKIISHRGAILIFALAIFVSGCSPSGPAALLKGKKCLDRGETADAVVELKMATTLLVTNAQAWNYYGVALQRAGDATGAASAYNRALDLNRDLVEAHFNLGSLWLEQNKPDAAKTELTAYTLRRSNDAAGWLKLGSAQLKLGDTVAAEKSFSTALYLSTNNAEAYNGLGIARIQRGRPRDAAQFFAAAIQFRPDYAPAILNLATVNQQYLRDNKTALENYRAYLALSPRPANWDEVNTLANSLEQSEIAATPPAPKTFAEPESKPVASEPPPVVATRPSVTNLARQSSANKTSPPRISSNPPTRIALNAMSAPPPALKPQVVQLPPEQIIVTKPAINKTSAPVQEMAAIAPAETPAEPEPQKIGFWHKINPTHWFNSTSADKNSSPKPIDENVTPLPGADASTEKPIAIIQPVPDYKPAPEKTLPPQIVAAPVSIAPTFARYNYLSPRKPRAGDRTAARGAFTKAQVYEQAGDWPNVLQWYAQAAQYDPSWFEAQYNLGVVAYQLRDFRESLTAYESALAIQPDSTDARYNFALALAAAGYVPDAVAELKKIVAANPNEVRNHLTLGNLYAQQLHEISSARPEYLKVLELDPNHEQASNIRFWLSANPQ
jgi:tetratricopeptide (TPR) repeat protein